eukprot:4272456-Pyramimonas_sp.AAC.1
MARSPAQALVTASGNARASRQKSKSEQAANNKRERGKPCRTPRASSKPSYRTPSRRRCEKKATRSSRSMDGKTAAKSKKNTTPPSSFAALHNIAPSMSMRFANKNRRHS